MKTLLLKNLQMMAALAFGLGLSVPTALAEEETVPQAPAGLEKIVMGSSGGITGKGDGSTLTVNRDSSFEAVIHTKKKEGKLNATELKKLQRLTRSVDWKSLKPSYYVGADQFASELKVTVDGAEWKTQVSAMPPADTPKELLALLDYLKELQRVHKP